MEKNEKVDKVEKISFKKLRAACIGAFSVNQKKFWVSYTENVNAQVREACVEIRKKAAEYKVIDVFPDYFQSISEHNNNPRLVENNMLLKQVVVFRTSSYDVPLYLGSYDSISTFMENCIEDFRNKLKTIINEQESYESRTIKANSGRTFGRSRKYLAR